MVNVTFQEIATWLLNPMDNDYFLRKSPESRIIQEIAKPIEGERHSRPSRDENEDDSMVYP